MSVCSLVRSISFGCSVARSVITGGLLAALMTAMLGGVGMMGGCQTYAPGWYSGDGAMYATPKGKGLSAVTAYDVELERVNLMTPGRHVFKLENLPREQMLTVLALDEPSQEKLEWIDKGRIRVALTIIEDGSGRTSVKEGHLLEDWNVTPESWKGEPLDFEGAWFRPQRHDVYTLVVDVFVDRAEGLESAPTTTITATPRVRGAGLGHR